MIARISATLARHSAAAVVVVGLMGLPSPSQAADLVDVSGVALDLDGGLSQTSPPESLTRLVHLRLGATIRIEAAGAGRWDQWRREFASDSDLLPAATLPRSDAYLYYVASRRQPMRSGPRTAFCLLIQDHGTAARIVVEIPTGAIPTAEIERFLAGVRVIDSTLNVPRDGLVDPRAAFDIPAGFAQPDPSELTFWYRDRQGAVSVMVRLTGEKAFESFVQRVRISARHWIPGTLPRDQPYLYFLVRPPLSAFQLAFRTDEISTEVHVTTLKANSDITTAQIERMLTTAHLAQ